MSAESRVRAESEAGGPEARPPASWRLVALSTSAQILLALALLVAGLWVLHKVASVLLLLALAILFSYMVAPLVAFFRRPIGWFGGRSLGLPPAIWAAYLSLAAVAALAIWLVWPVLNAQFAELRAQLPDYLVRIQTSWKTWKAGQTRMMPRGARAVVEDLVDQASNGALGYIRKDLLPRVAGWLLALPWLILVPIFAFFFLKDAELFRQRALKLFLERRLRWRGDLFFEEVSRTLAAYIRALVAGCLVVATLSTVGFLAIGIPYPLLFGVAAGLFEFLPLVGPFVIAMIVVSIAGMQTLSKAILVAGFLLLLRVAEDYVIYPRLVGRELPLHPMAVILAILCGAELGGVAGVFLAVPTLAILTVAFRHWRAHQNAAPPPRPSAA
ncbi:MAG TPA: AI-2E family transporter [Thermoanaerobaculia bacterium]|nr:AI-2E family transporter [Thermoanaerobaculia bacterium]